MESNVANPDGREVSGVDANYRPQTPWTAPRALLATLAILVAGGVAGVGAFKLVARLAGLESAPADRGFEAIVWLGMTQVVMVVLTYVASRQFGGQPQRVLALGPPAGGWRDYAIAMGQLIVGLAAFNALMYFVFKVDLMTDLKPFLEIIRHPGWLVALLVIGIGAPVSEELLFRGFLQSALSRSRIGFWPGAGIATGMWTALHIGYSLVGLAEVALIGMLFSWVLWRSGSTRVTVVCHAVYNTALALLMRFYLAYKLV